MTVNKYREVWDLDILFPGGSESDQFRKHLEELEVKVSQFKSKVEFFHTPQVIETLRNSYNWQKNEVNSLNLRYNITCVIVKEGYAASLLNI